MAQTVFNRVEKKYKLTKEKYDQFLEKLLNYMEIDQFGKHTISNIYYDTADNVLIRRSIEKPAYKEKLRLRSYGTPSISDSVFLEIKKKYDGIVNKRRIELPLQLAYNYLNSGIHPFESTQILNEMDYFLSLYDLSPKLLLAYERIALFGKEDSEFRVTFDTNIRSRTEDLHLEHGSHGKLLFDDQTHLMEVKITNSTPLWFSKLLSEYEIYNSSFSKYGSVYKKQQQELANLNSSKAKVNTSNNPVFVPEAEYDFIAG